MVSFTSLLYAASTFLTSALAAQLKVHDSSFAPDYSLHITQQDISMACRSRSSAVVNGTIPGPVVTLQENKTSWVRVYNDMPSANLTMVFSQSLELITDIQTD